MTDDCTRSLKILALTTSYPKNSTCSSGRFVAEWAQEISKRRIQCDVLAPPGYWSVPPIGRQTYSDPFGLLNQFGVPDQWSKHPAKTTLSGLATTASMSYSAWNDITAYDFVVGHWLLPSALIALGAGRRHGIGVHAISHGGDVALLESFPRAWSRRLCRMIHDKVAGLTFVSPHLARRFETMMDQPLGSHVSIAPMGVRLERPNADFADMLRSRAGQRRIVVTVGRLNQIKGLDVLARALADMNDVVWFAAGDGLEKDSLQALSTRLNIDFVPLGQLPKDRVSALLHVADLFIQPSRTVGRRDEGTPVAVLEALSTPVPSIVTDTGGLKELARRSGALCIASDDSQALKRAIGSVLHAPERQADMRSSHSGFARTVSWTHLGPIHRRHLEASITRFRYAAP